MEAQIPAEVWLTIFSFLNNEQQLSSCARVSHRWKLLLDDEIVWKCVFGKKFVVHDGAKILLFDNIASIFRIGWKQIYQQVHGRFLRRFATDEISSYTCYLLRLIPPENSYHRLRNFLPDYVPAPRTTTPQHLTDMMGGSSSTLCLFYVSLVTHATAIIFRYTRRVHDSTWSWSPDLDHWMSTSTTRVSGGIWDGHHPVHRNIHLINALHSSKCFPEFYIIHRESLLESADMPVLVYFKESLLNAMNLEQIFAGWKRT